MPALQLSLIIFCYVSVVQFIPLKKKNLQGNLKVLSVIIVVCCFPGLV